MPSGSNVLLLVVKSKVSLLYLEELENSVLRVTPALEFEVSTDQLANVMLGELRYNILLSVEAVWWVITVWMTIDGKPVIRGDGDSGKEYIIVHFK